MKKKILCLAMTVVMVVGGSMTAYAKEHQGSDSWLVDFDGKNLNSNFGSSNLADEAENVQPGDSIDLKVQIKNSDSGKTDWYMSNEVIQTLEEGKEQADGGAYEYKLSYVSSSETKILYDSTAVGGETNTGGEGLHQATEALEDYFYLDRLSSGQSGTVHLWVKIEGETTGNGYQTTLAKLQMNFAVEKVTDGQETIPRNITRTIYEADSTRVIRQTVKTGDTTKVLLLCVLALVSGIALLVLGVKSMKKNQKHSSRKGE